MTMFADRESMVEEYWRRKSCDVFEGVRMASGITDPR